MQAIQLTGSDVALITLALISDRMGAQTSVSLPQLETEWLSLGLRADDLIQGIITLTREQDAALSGEGADTTLQLGPSLAAQLSAPGEGFKSLDQRLQGMLEFAASRKEGSPSDHPHSNERRDGFK